VKAGRLGVSASGNCGFVVTLDGGLQIGCNVGIAALWRSGQAANRSRSKRARAWHESGLLAAQVELPIIGTWSASRARFGFPTMPTPS